MPQSLTMSNNIDRSDMSVSEHKDKDIDSDTPGTPPARVEDVEKIGTSAVVDKETERRLLKKLDVRIIPMVCWIYLVSRGCINSMLEVLLTSTSPL
jgi:hypothetical protein